MTPSSVSSRGTSKCGYSQGISKVGPRAATAGTERRGMGGRSCSPAWNATDSLSRFPGLSLALHLVLGRERWEQFKTLGSPPTPNISFRWAGTVLSTSERLALVTPV